MGGDEWLARCDVSPNLTLENRLTNCSLEICVPKPPSMGFWGVPRARVRPAGLAPPARRPQLPQPNSARFWGSNHATHAPNSLPVTCADVFPISWHIFVREGHKTMSPTRPPHPHAPTSCGVPMHPERELCDQMREMQPGRGPPRHPSPTTSRSMHDVVFCEGNG